MSTTSAVYELQETISSTWPWVVDAGGQIRDTQIRRIKWLEFLQALESDPPVDLGLALPFVVLEFGPWTQSNEADGWGYAGKTLVSHFNVFLVDEASVHNHNLTSVGPGAAVGISDTERFYAGQKLWFPVPGAEREIVSVDSSVQLTLDDVTGLSPGLAMFSPDKTADLEHDAQLLCTALGSPNLFDNFFTVDSPAIDSSSMNAANLALTKANYPMQAVQLTGALYVSP